MAATVQLAHKVHVLGRKEDLDTVRMAGKVAIVLDVLFATSTIVTAVAHGAESVIPALDEAAAREEAARHDAGAVVLAGELYAETLPGFAPPTPLALVAHGVAAKTVIYSTTNGTAALKGATGAEDVYAAALLNGRAVIEHVLAAHRDRTILIVCSGSMGNFNLEDFYGAGYLVDLVAERLGEGADFSDAARVARAFYRSGDPFPTLLNCRVGRMMAARGLEHEIEFAAQRSALEVIPRLAGGRLSAA
ncbi:MAG TPA: 2-phosphosulfolactate phosphatase [Burkholderiales bacterium]|nr:2-phosphosulfolactate phosphatase [Burkholderiales bacterium]